MFAAEFANHCDLGAWGTNSQVVAAVSSSPAGPYVRQNVAVPAWSHNPEAVQAPDGTLVLYTLGSGKPSGPEQNCTTGGGGGGDTTVSKLDEALRQRRQRGGIKRITVQAGAPNFTLHSAASPYGPWLATTMVIEGWNSSWNLDNWNLAPVMLKDGSVRVMAHTRWRNAHSTAFTCGNAFKSILFQKTFF